MVKKFLLALGTLLCFTIAPVQQSAGGIIDDLPPQEAIECIAKNIYYEARGESIAGQISVGMVVLNRVNDARFPSTICGVVYQGKSTEMNTPKQYRKHSCQFSWVCDGKVAKRKDPVIWQQSLHVAKTVYRMYKQGYDITGGATHYHAYYVKPAWSSSKSMKTTGKIDSHIFYRWEI